MTKDDELEGEKAAVEKEPAILPMGYQGRVLSLLHGARSLHPSWPTGDRKQLLICKGSRSYIGIHPNPITYYGAEYPGPM